MRGFADSRLPARCPQRRTPASAFVLAISAASAFVEAGQGCQPHKKAAAGQEGGPPGPHRVNMAEVAAIAADKAPVVAVRDLHKSVGALEVLKGISFSAREGEVISLIGSSGSGKSTLLRCINMLEVPDSGS